MGEDLEDLAAAASAGDQEAAAQDALLAVATKIHTFRGTGSFAGWMTIVATNCARQTYRSLKRRSRERSTELLPEPVDPRTTSVIAGSRLDLLEALDALEAEHPQLVQPLVLRDLGGMSYAEIADELDSPLGTIKARIHQGRKQVAQRLAVR